MVNRSFTEYMKKRFDNSFWAVAEEFLTDNTDYVEGLSYKLHKVGDVEILDVSVEHVWVEDKPDMEIQFDVAISVNFCIQEGDYHYDDSEERSIWLMVQCRGDLDKNLDDFEILQYDGYNGKSRGQDPMDDSLVPYIPTEKMEKEAEAFLSRYFPEALKVPFRGQAPIWVDPTILAEKMGLSIKSHRIKEDASVFGQIYFEDTETELYSEADSCNKLMRVPGKTILVDPEMFLLRNLGSINNTIIHECVHWDKHRKAFKLEKLFNSSATCISCGVEGGASTGISKNSTDFMEIQANQLAPRIQMPREPFAAKAKEYIASYMRAFNARHEIDVMEQVIETLAVDFGVSRQAAKIRLVQLGFDNAIGTFTYVDGHYVKPHCFKKDAIEVSQTYTIGAQDAAIQRFINKELAEKTSNGDYLFIENHYVYNSPLYVEAGFDGKLELTAYARSHMDECCLAFDMKITSKVESQYHTVCYLNREPSDITFEIKYHNGYENAPQERQVAMRQKQMQEWMDIRKQMTDDPEQCMELLLDWRGMNYTDLGLMIDRDPKTISRTVKGTTAPKVETAALICLAMKLPPMISDKLMDVLGCKLKPMDMKHQWINEALHVKYMDSLDAVVEYLEPYGIDLGIEI